MGSGNRRTCRAGSIPTSPTIMDISMIHIDAIMNYDWRSEQALARELEEMLQPGNIVDVFYNHGNPNNKKYEVRAIVDSKYIVCKELSDSGRRYVIRDVYDFCLLMAAGGLRQENG